MPQPSDPGATSPIEQTVGQIRRAATDGSAFLVGVVGFSGSWSQNTLPDAEVLARRELVRLFDSLNAPRPWCVSGATNSGVPAVAYSVARERGIPCIGVTATIARGFRLAPLSRIAWVGRDFGDESSDFVELCDAFWMIGGGLQSEREMRMAADRAKPITVVRGFGGAADRLTPHDLPSARFVSPLGPVGPTPHSSGS